MKPETGKIYHVEMNVALPFPLGKKTIPVTVYIDSPASFHMKGSYKDHGFALAGGEINEDVLAIKGEVAGKSGEFCFVIEDDSTISGTASAWKFHDLKVTGKVIAVQ